MSKSIIIGLFVAVIVVIGAIWLVLLFRSDAGAPVSTTGTNALPVAGETTPQQWEKELRDYEAELRRQETQFDAQIRQLEQAP